MSESANEAGPVLGAGAGQPAAPETPAPAPVAIAPAAPVVAAAPSPVPSPVAPSPVAAPAAEPSIVVEDAALAAVAVQTPASALNARPADVATSHGNGHAEPWSEAPMTPHDADRFASRFKASWDVEEPASTSSPGTARGASPSITPSQGVWADTSREEVALPMQRTTRSPIFWGGIALVLGVCGILIALMTGSHSDASTAAAATARTTGTTGAPPPPVSPLPPIVAPAIAENTPPPASPFAAAGAGAVPPVVAPPVVVPPVIAPPVIAPQVIAPPPPVVAPPVVAPPVIVPPVIAPPVIAPPPPVVAPPPPVVAPPPPVHVVAPPPPVHVAPPPPPPPMAHLVIHTTPSDAHLTLDGATIANPFDGRLARGGTRHLTATATGYDPSTQTVDLSRDRTLTVTLARQHVAAPVHHNPPPSHHAPPPHHDTHGSHAHNTGHGGFVSANPFD